jgi:hypothetical protein
MLYENTTYHTKSYIHYIYLYPIEHLHGVLQWDIDILSQHSSSIVSIRLFLDNDYGTILSYWNKRGNNVGNIEATFFFLNIAFCLHYLQTLLSGENVADKT